MADDADLRRDDLRELRDRQRLHRHQAAEHGDDRDDDGDDRAADEEARTRLSRASAGVGERLDGVTTVPSRVARAFDDHAVAGLEALLDDPAAADAFADRDGLACSTLSSAPTTRT